MKDQKIIDMLRSGNRTKALEKVYVNFPKIKQLIIQKGGNEDEAKDIFQESIVIFYNNAVKPEFNLTSAISTYLYGVSHNLWMKYLRDIKKKEIQSDNNIELEALETDVNQHLEEEKKFSIIAKVITQVGDRCMEILQKYYYQRMSMKEIAHDMGYNTDKIAKNQKYKCLEKARSLATKQYSEGREVLS